ncbi:MAG: DUF192 domain-containing protein [Nanoarchaeota archaeon]|nr:DUF192 domain-containing protein [Nanoarchaeota archaeon]
MKQEKIILRYKKKKVPIVVARTNLFEKVSGLMFTDREKAKALLLFDFKKPHMAKIHSFFVFFKFIAAWADDKNEIMEIKIVRPWSPLVLPEKPFSKLIEIPLNKRYMKISEILVGKRKI